MVPCERKAKRSRYQSIWQRINSGYYRLKWQQKVSKHLLTKAP
ncbi:hypothetical protein HPTD01_1119 [Halomonas sp. TD01]|nr:hypothetical protein HPTD01_1119 [Halomonas sp. TD01]